MALQSVVITMVAPSEQDETLLVCQFCQIERFTHLLAEPGVEIVQVPQPIISAKVIKPIRAKEQIIHVRRCGALAPARAIRRSTLCRSRALRLWLPWRRWLRLRLRL